MKDFFGHTIRLIADQTVQPGHQLIAVTPADASGEALLYTLTGRYGERQAEMLDEHGAWLIAPHDHACDERLIQLVDLCAELRYSAPGLIQLGLDLNGSDPHTHSN